MKSLNLEQMASLQGGGATTSTSRACNAACELRAFACANGLRFLQRIANRLIDMYCTSCCPVRDTD